MIEENNRMDTYIKVTTEVPEKSAVINAFDNIEEIGCFSLDSRCQELDDRTAMKRYYYSQPLGNERLDLNEGFDKNFRNRIFPDDKIDNILKWIMDENFQPVISEPTEKFVSTRGTIVKVLCTPYLKGHYSSWRIYASKFRNMIYFTSVDTEAKVDEERNADEPSLRKIYYGHKFEQYMTTDEPGGEPNLMRKCDEQGMFCIIAKNRIGNHTLLIRAEMDAVRSDAGESRDTSPYVELKTCEIGDIQKRFYYKPLQWWAQSTVVGIKCIICGFRDDSGQVTSIKEFKTEDLPKRQKPYRCPVRGCSERFRDLSSLRKHIQNSHPNKKEFDKRKKNREWSPEVCIYFLNEFLNWLKSNLKDDPKAVCRLDYKGGDKVLISYESDGTNRVIRDWYVQELRRYEAMGNTAFRREDNIIQGSSHSAFSCDSSSSLDIPSDLRDRSPHRMDACDESSTQVRGGRNRYRSRSRRIQDRS